MTQKAILPIFKNAGSAKIKPSYWWDQLVMGVIWWTGEIVLITARLILIVCLLQPPPGLPLGRLLQLPDQDKAGEN